MYKLNGAYKKLFITAIRSSKNVIAVKNSQVFFNIIIFQIGSSYFRLVDFFTKQDFTSLDKSKKYIMNWSQCNLVHHEMNR